MSFAGKVAIITGASSGIGAATAILFAAEGCSLSITGRNLHNLQSIKDKCISEGLSEKKIMLLIGDVKDTAFLEKLVNNAGIGLRQSLLDTSMEQIEDVFSTNFKAPIKLTQLCSPYLKEVKGNIVNVSSTTGVNPCRRVPIYSASMASLDSITRCMAFELAPDVRVNCVIPSRVKTPMFSRHRDDEVFDDETDLKFEKMAIDSAPTPATFAIAKIILFYAHDKAKYNTADRTHIWQEKI